LAVLWIASFFSYFLRLFGLSSVGVWHIVALQIAAALYFYVRWSVKDAQHRTFHFLLLCALAFRIGFYVYQFWITSFRPELLHISLWWYQLISNVLFELSLILVFAYALIYRHAQKDKMKYRNEIAEGFEKAGMARRAWLSNIRRIFTRFGPRP